MARRRRAGASPGSPATRATATRPTGRSTPTSRRCRGSSATTSRPGARSSTSPTGTATRRGRRRRRDGRARATCRSTATRGSTATPALTPAERDHLVDALMQMAGEDGNDDDNSGPARRRRRRQAAGPACAAGDVADRVRRSVAWVAMTTDHERDAAADVAGAAAADHRDELPDDLERRRLRRPVPVPGQLPPPHPGDHLPGHRRRCACWPGRCGTTPRRSSTAGFVWAAVLLTVVAIYLVHLGLADARRREGGAGQGPAGGRVPRRPRLGPAGLAGHPQPADVAGAVLLDRGSAARRGLVLVDAVDGEVVEHLVEDNPERWSAAPPPSTLLTRRRRPAADAQSRRPSLGRPTGCAAARRRRRGPRRAASSSVASSHSSAGRSSMAWATASPRRGTCA